MSDLKDPLPLTCHMFGGRNGEEENALRSAMTTAAHDAGCAGEYKEYAWFAESGRTTIAVGLVEALHRHGYRIVKMP